MATIKDVARLAGVSVSTVSRVINQSGYVGAESHAKVLKAMEQLHFAPSDIARGLVSRKTSSIGLLIPDVANPFFSDVARGTEDAAIAEGFTIILCNSDWQLHRERMYLDLLRGKWVEGVIVVGSRSEERELTKAIGSLPFVLVDQRATSGRSSSVWMNNERGGFVATQHLLDMGCRRVVHVTGPVDSPSAAAREVGFLQAVKAFSETSGERLEARRVPGDFRYDGGYRAALEWFGPESSADRRPDGIFAANDLMAIGIIQAAQSLGVHVPEDVSVIGYDNIAMAEYVAPKLTTVDQPGYRMGQAAFEMLHRRLQTGVNQQESQEFEPTLILRQSTRRMGSLREE